MSSILLDDTSKYISETSIIITDCIYDTLSPLKLTPQRKPLRILEDRLPEVRKDSRSRESLPEGFPSGKECVRNASRRKALHLWYPSHSLIKLHTSQQAIIFVCFSFSQVSTHSLGAVHCVNTPQDPLPLL